MLSLQISRLNWNAVRNNYIMKRFVYIKNNEINIITDFRIPQHENPGIEYQFEYDNNVASYELDGEGNIVPITKDQLLERLNNGELS